jgi:hypothetical protein
MTKIKVNIVNNTHDISLNNDTFVAIQILDLTEF